MKVTRSSPLSFDALILERLQPQTRELFEIEVDVNSSVLR